MEEAANEAVEEAEMGRMIDNYQPLQITLPNEGGVDPSYYIPDGEDQLSVRRRANTPSNIRDFFSRMSDRRQAQYLEDQRAGRYALYGSNRQLPGSFYDAGAARSTVNDGVGIGTDVSQEVPAPLPPSPGPDAPDRLAPIVDRVNKTVRFVDTISDAGSKKLLSRGYVIYYQTLDQKEAALDVLSSGYNVAGSFRPFGRRGDEL